MAESSSYLKKKTRSTFLTSLFSISLVLFVLALLVTSALFFDHMRDKWQEEFEMLVVLDEEPNASRQQYLEGVIKEKAWCQGLRYVSKKDAEAEFLTNTADQFYSEIMGDFNPMKASINVRLKVEWIQTDSLAAIEKELSQIPDIADVQYPIQYIQQLRENTKTLYGIAIGACLLVIIVAFFIISGTIRLAIFAKRLVIRSMQLIGARNRFIRAPFIRMGLTQGATGAIIASALLVVVMFAAAGISEDLVELRQVIKSARFAALLGGIVIFGALLGWFSSRLAVNRFLNKPLDELM